MVTNKKRISSLKKTVEYIQQQILNIYTELQNIKYMFKVIDTQ